MKFLKKYKPGFILIVFVVGWAMILSCLVRSKTMIKAFNKTTRNDVKYKFQESLFKQSWSNSKCKVFVIGDFEFAKDVEESKNVFKFLVSGMDHVELEWILNNLAKEKRDHLFIQSSPHVFSNLDHDEGSSGPRPDIALWRQTRKKGSKRLYDIELFFQTMGTMAENLYKKKNSETFKLLTYEYLSILSKEKLDTFFTKFKQDEITWVNEVSRFPVTSNPKLMTDYKAAILKNPTIHVIESSDLSKSIQQEVEGCK